MKKTWTRFKGQCHDHWFFALFSHEQKMATAHASVADIRPWQLGKSHEQFHRPSSAEQMAFTSSNPHCCFLRPCLVAAIIFPHTKWLPKITNYCDTAALKEAKPDKCHCLTVAINAWAIDWHKRGENGTNANLMCFVKEENIEKSATACACSSIIQLSCEATPWNGLLMSFRQKVPWLLFFFPFVV